jgi:osmotically inducible lipoprotein OsmB
MMSALRPVLLVFATALALVGCGHNMEQRAATGAITGAVVAGPVGAAVGAGVGAVVNTAAKSH